MQVVYEGSYATAGPAGANYIPPPYDTLVAEMMRRRPDTLVGCTLEQDAMGLAHELVSSGVLLGAMPPLSDWSGAVPARVTSRVLHPTPYTLHPTPYTLYPTPFTLHPTPYTLHPTPCTLHPTARM